MVDVTSDTVDANPGDGVCADSDGNCSLRAAVMEANATLQDTLVTFDPSVTWVHLSLDGPESEATGDLKISSGTDIVLDGRNSSSGYVRIAAGLVTGLAARRRSQRATPTPTERLD